MNLREDLKEIFQYELKCYLRIYENIFNRLKALISAISGDKMFHDEDSLVYEILVGSKKIADDKEFLQILQDMISYSNELVASLTEDKVTNLFLDLNFLVNIKHALQSFIRYNYMNSIYEKKSDEEFFRSICDNNIMNFKFEVGFRSY